MHIQSNGTEMAANIKAISTVVFFHSIKIAPQFADKTLSKFDVIVAEAGDKICFAAVMMALRKSLRA
jgi:hypothetical protein